MIVADASAILELILPSAGSGVVWDRVDGSPGGLHAPHLVDIEVAQVIRRYVAGRKIDEDHGRSALQEFALLRLRRHPHTGLLRRVWELRHNLTAYDAAYVALAETLDATLLTRDARLARAPGHSARVELI